MDGWLYITAAILVALPLVWLARRRSHLTVDLEPVSAHWLAEHKRSSTDGAHL